MDGGGGADHPLLRTQRSLTIPSAFREHQQSIYLPTMSRLKVLSNRSNAVEDQPVCGPSTPRKADAHRQPTTYHRKMKALIGELRASMAAYNEAVGPEGQLWRAAQGLVNMGTQIEYVSPRSARLRSLPNGSLSREMAIYVLTGGTLFLCPAATHYPSSQDPLERQSHPRTMRSSSIDRRWRMRWARL